MSRERVSPGEATKPQQFRLGASDHKALNAIAKTTGEPKAQIIRDIVVKFIRSNHRTAVAKRARKGAKKSFPIRAAAARKKKRR